MADLIADIGGINIIKKHIKGPQGVRGRNSDNGQLRKALHWAPEILLEEGLKGFSVKGKVHKKNA